MVSQPTDGAAEATVTYKGTSNVKTIGKVVWTVPISDFDSKLDLFKASGFYSLKSGYPVAAANQHTTLAVKAFGVTKKVSDYGMSVPDILLTLQQDIETWLNVASLTVIPPPLGQAGDNISLFRKGCEDGSCKIYTISYKLEKKS